MPATAPTNGAYLVSMGHTGAKSNPTGQEGFSALHIKKKKKPNQVVVILIAITTDVIEWCFKVHVYRVWLERRLRSLEGA